jgi:hypothetical protein
MNFVSSGALSVYRNEESFKRRKLSNDEGTLGNKKAFKRRRLAYMGNEEPLDPTEPLDSLGSKNDMLIVVAPSRKDAQLLHHPERKRRWEKLNRVLENLGRMNPKKNRHHILLFHGKLSETFLTPLITHKKRLI